MADSKVTITLEIPMDILASIKHANILCPCDWTEQMSMDASDVVEFLSNALDDQIGADWDKNVPDKSEEDDEEDYDEE